MLDESYDSELNISAESNIIKTIKQLKKKK